MSTFQRAVRRLGATRAWSAVGRFLAPADRVLLKVTRGRLGVGTAAGMSTVLLTTTGRSSGQPRQVPLLYVRHGGGLVVVATNWGGQRHPGWSANLLAEPRATVTHAGSTWSVRARLLGDPERAEAWAALVAHWPAYEKYAERAPQRTIRIFHLTRI
ncbi:nitroreductase family deazaflavin-dependent oxidoreductase [Streptomyces sp. NPDC088747]|uniref:nitroreductase family deazaflavin-dependent oxidoreductase n=1 Tax=Streptomyces sp. NPDC088747 TaxID=3365886 RepID=UPI0038067CA2